METGRDYGEEVAPRGAGARVAFPDGGRSESGSHQVLWVTKLAAEAESERATPRNLRRALGWNGLQRGVRDNAPREEFSVGFGSADHGYKPRSLVASATRLMPSIFAAVLIVTRLSK